MIAISIYMLERMKYLNKSKENIVSNCIFCNKPLTSENESVEHVIPEALGNTSLKIRAVCINCNSQLGAKVDSELSNNFYIELARHVYRIKGKSGKAPNPFNQGVLLNDNNQKVRIKFDNDGKTYPQLITNKTVKNHDGKDEFRFVFDKSEEANIPNIVNTFLKRKGKPPLSTEAIENLYNEKSQRIETKHTYRFDINGYKKAILKIVYEGAYYLLGDSILLTDEMKKINKAIWDFSDDWANSKKNLIKGTITFYSDDSCLKQAFELISKSSDHIIALFPSDGGLCIVVKIFDIYWGVVPIATDTNMYDIPQQDCILVDSLSGKCEIHNLRDLILKGVATKKS